MSWYSLFLCRKGLLKSKEINKKNVCRTFLFFPSSPFSKTCLSLASFPARGASLSVTIFGLCFVVRLLCGWVMRINDAIQPLWAPEPTAGVANMFQCHAFQKSSHSSLCLLPRLPHGKRCDKMGSPFSFLTCRLLAPPPLPPAPSERAT